MTEILVVDDYIVQQRVLRHVLSSVGYQVIVANDGIEALEYLAQTPVSLVILDIALPDLDGIEVLLRIRADAALANLPVVMLTASGSDDVKIAARRAGATAFLSKPASSHEVIRTVQSLIGEPL